MSLSPKRSPYSPKRSPARKQMSPMRTSALPYPKNGNSSVLTINDTTYKKIPSIPNHKSLIELRLIGAEVTNFVGIKPMDSLEILRIDNSRIKSFYGAFPLPNLKHFTLKNTPLSLFEYTPVMARIVFGSNLEIVGSKPLTPKEKAIARRLGDMLYNWLIDGWLLTSINPIHIYHPETQGRKILFVSTDFTPVPMSPMSSPTKTIKPVPPAPPSTRAPEEDQEEMNEEEAIIEVDNENQAEIPVENLEIAQEENQEEIVQEDEFQDSNELVIDERLEQEINKDLKQANLEEEEQGIEDLLENNDGNNSDKEVEELLKLAGDDDFDDQQIEDLIKSDNE